MGYQDGSITASQAEAKEQLTRLIRDLRRGLFSSDKLDLAYTNPDEFLAEYLPMRIEGEERAEVIGIIKHTIVTGFFRSTVRAALADNAEAN
ncbi:MAG TPA: hypothetical protein VK465_01450 [Fibrobacteria bacterium]|nr:hypothetical protein [Fibrobacteria bacterium]